MAIKKVGPILGIVGASLLLLGGLISFTTPMTLEATLALLTLTFEQVGLDPIFLTINSIITLAWGILGLVGAILALKDKKMGVYLMLIFGIFASVGIFIPITTYTVPVPISITFSIPLNGSFLFVDPFLLLVGGILGLTLKEE